MTGKPGETQRCTSTVILSPHSPDTPCPAPAASSAAEPAPPTLTFVLRSEASHGQWQGLVELLFLRDKGLAYRVGVVPQHAQVAPDLVQEGLQRHAYPGLPLVRAVPHHHVTSRGRQEGRSWRPPPGGLSVVSGSLSLSLSFGLHNCPNTSDCWQPTSLENKNKSKGKEKLYEEGCRLGTGWVCSPWALKQDGNRCVLLPK